MKLSKQRLEAFSDGIIAIIITIMVLSIPSPTGFDFDAILNLLGTIFIYFISFIVVGSFWNQHHRVFSYIEQITNKVIWVNLLFLFFLSLIPLFTKWVMENPGHLTPVICYDIVYLLTNFTYVFIFHFVINNSEHEAIKQILDKRKEMESKRISRPKYTWLRLGATGAIMLGIILLSIYKPQISTILLLGLPVVSSVANLLFDNYNRKPKDNTM